MSFSIEGKTAIVTGAANGVGLAIGRHFVEQGANVVFADMDEAALTHEIGDMVSDEGTVRMFAGDLRRKLTIANLLSTTIDAFERIDILVNGARQVERSDPLDSDGNQVMELLEQNMLASLKLSQAVAKKMIKQSEGNSEGQCGSIINLSSIAARRAQAELMAYSISTAAADQMTLPKAMEFTRIR